ncbi:Metallo-hydrolase/oxidoreductase [Pilatotrama ljubarskyi]|nr:Metallo-hydrolase/oxidoreductase [Pilatotrama ljubarskyi]
MSLPAPSANQPYVQVSALYAGSVDVPVAWVLDGVEEDERMTVPALAFLIRHPAKSDKLLFDLGIRPDWQNLPPPLTKYVVDHLGFRISVPQDAVTALAKGGLEPTDITHVCYSHLHFDHIGDSAPFTNATFLVGQAAQPVVADGYPKNPNAPVAADLLPEGRTTFLDPASWPPLGPFPHVLDFYGDGSLYIVDAGSGHFPGHLNVLARTSADGGWVYLAGDSAHHWSLITGEGKIAKTAHFGCAHIDVAAAEEHMSRIRTLMKENPRVKVILAHDVPWYEQSKNGPAFWPGSIESP